MIVAEGSVLWTRYCFRFVTVFLARVPREKQRTGLSTVVINLDNRTDRWLAVSKHLEANQIAHSRFAAISHQNGLAGCALSHAAVLQQGLEQGLSEILVVEDDVEFVGSIAEINAVLEEFRRSPVLDVLCLAHVSRRPRLKVSQNLRIAHSISTTAAYVAKRRAMGPLIETFAESASQIAGGKPREIFALDVLWQRLQKRSFLFAIPVTALATQSASYSDIQERFVDYTPEYKKSFLS